MIPRHKRISLVNLALTTRCNRRCPHCSYGIHLLHDYWDISWDELVRVARLLGNVGRINLTGGEPTMHPQFRGWAPLFKEVFAPNDVSVETNGYGFTLFPEAFMHLDLIAPTLYDDSCHGGASNKEDIRFITKYRDVHRPELPIRTTKANHLPRTQRNGNRDCFRAASGAIAFFRDRLYPCCTAQGIENAASVGLTGNWRREVMACPLACERCLFAGQYPGPFSELRALWRRLVG